MTEKDMCDIGNMIETFQPYSDEQLQKIVNGLKLVVAFFGGTNNNSMIHTFLIQELETYENMLQDRKRV